VIDSKLVGADFTQSISTFWERLTFNAKALWPSDSLCWKIITKEALASAGLKIGNVQLGVFDLRS